MAVIYTKQNCNTRSNAMQFKLQHGGVKILNEIQLLILK